MIGLPSDYTISKSIIQADGGLLEKIYKNNMNGLDSFLKEEDGIEYLLKGDRVALISHKQFIRPFEKARCQVNILAKELLILKCAYRISAETIFF